MFISDIFFYFILLGIEGKQGAKLASVDARGWGAKVHSHAVSVPAFKTRKHRCHRRNGEAGAQAPATTCPFLFVISYCQGSSPQPQFSAISKIAMYLLKPQYHRSRQIKLLKLKFKKSWLVVLLLLITCCASCHHLL